MIRVGCPWRLLPKDFPPFTTVQNRFYAWRDSGLWTQIVGVLVVAAREAEGRKPRRRPSSSIANRSRRRRRAVRAASTQARKSRGANDISPWIRSACRSNAKSHPRVSKIETPSRPCSVRFIVESPWVTMSFVDSGYQGDEAQRAAYEASQISVTVVKRTDTTVKGFIVLPKRWVVERTLGWINRARRLSKDFEATIESSLAWLQLALAFLLMRRLARQARPAEFRVRLERLRAQNGPLIRARGGDCHSGLHGDSGRCVLVLWRDADRAGR